MVQLAANAKKRGDKAEALRWSQQAFDKAEGPATRLQWGAGYLSNLVELAPQDEARIEAAATQLLAEAAAQPNAFYERSARSLQRVGSKLATWNDGQKHAAAVQRLQAQLDGVCARLPADDAPQRGVCSGLLKSGKTTKT
jgi:cytochrome c556